MLDGYEGVKVPSSFYVRSNALAYRGLPAPVLEGFLANLTVLCTNEVTKEAGCL